MVAVAYRRWSFTRGSNCKALTGEILVFWIGGRLWELVTYEWCLHMEVSSIFKFIIGFEAWGNKTEESILQCRASS